MVSASNKQIPKSFRANRSRFLQWLGRAVLSFFGWKVKGGIEEKHNHKKLVVLIAPHTSNWDGIFGVAALAGLDAKITFIGKHTAFKYGLGAFLRYMGGIPVDRSRPGGIIQHAIDQIKEIDGSLIAISPEGTRSKVKEWKTGFLRIAKEIKAEIVPASLDYSKKEILLGKVFKLSGDNQKDISDLKKYYSAFKPKHPEKY
jgi:1-acyl-sn-glycerol-3-phosphate acyltransferase|tara:strand:- start:8841 stop:9443 length:603 start_codon:yes stop_codon:yes gene_type:complete